MELVKLTPTEFKRIAKIVYDQTGIHLADEKLTLLSNRLRKRLRELGLETFAEYQKLLERADTLTEEMPHFLSSVTTNETYFFRNEALWKFFRTKWIPEIRKNALATNKRSVRIWSAASSTGEEAYTAAICLREELRDFDAWKVSIIGSDLSPRVLEKAQAGLYNDYAVSKLPSRSMKLWFKQVEGGYQISDAIKSMVQFKQHNLRDPFPNGRFDFVFLRNVLMYFDLEMKRTVVRNVQDALVPGGHLIIGDVDPVRNCAEMSDVLEVQPVATNVYIKPAASAVGAKG